MEQKNSSILTLSKQQFKEVESYCRLNELDVQTFLHDCFKQGFLIEKNGLLNPLKTGGVEKNWVEKEVIVEKRVEIPVEVIKEVQIEIIVEKEVLVTDETRINELLLKIQQLETDNKLFSTKVNEKDETLLEFSTKTNEMENILQQEKDELLLKIQQLTLDHDTQISEYIRKIDECCKKPSVDGSKQQALQETIQKLMGDNKEKSNKILQLEKSLLELESMAYQKGILLRSSNLNDNLYK
jgi:hypothetical protein